MKTIIALLLMASSCFADGLYDETITPISGDITSYRRANTTTISNELNQPITIMFTTEGVKLYPDDTLKTFIRRVSVTANDYEGKQIPWLSPITGEQIGYFDTNMLYSLVYSAWILAEKQADSLVGTLISDPATICYTTNASDPVCKLP